MNADRFSGWPACARIMAWNHTSVMVLVTPAYGVYYQIFFCRGMAVCKQQLRTTPGKVVIGTGCCHASHSPHPPHPRLPHCLQPHCCPCHPLDPPALQQASLPTTLCQWQHIARLTVPTMPLQLLQALSPSHHPVLAAVGRERLSGLKCASVCILQSERAVDGEQVHSSMLPHPLPALLCFVHCLLSYAHTQILMLLQHALLSC